MKRNNVIIGSVGIVATAALFAVSLWGSADSEGTYTQETFSSLSEKSSDDARAWMERRYLDPETGERISNKKLRAINTAVSQMKKSRAVTFIEQGPDNIGGRTRAIQVDVTNNDIIWAGGVSGGLFKSLNGANTWERVDSYGLLCSPFISSMTQFTNGTLFVATGSNDEPWAGDGVWYTQDQGISWTLVPGTSSFRVNEVVAPTNGTTLWLTSPTGLKKWNFGDATLTNVATGNGGCNSLACSSNGQIIVAAIGSNRTYVSSNGGNTFVNKSGSGADVVPFGAVRIEYAISHSTNASGNYSIYAVRTNSNLMGMNVSHDNGNTWSQFIGASGTPSNLDIYRNQGWYNTVVSVSPQSPEKIFIGGIDIWKWEQTSNNPPTGGFERLSEWFFSPTSPKYVHADNHEMKWDGNKLYIGNDGGVNVSYNVSYSPDPSFYPANRGYNVTQFYGIAFDRNGAVLGGSQDNGTMYNDHQLSTFKEFTEVSGGDGFQCEISFYNPKIMFTTVQYGRALRSGDGGATVASFVPNPLPAGYEDFGSDGSNQHPFHSHIFLAEYYDLNSRDSVLFIPDANFAVGETISVPSAASGDTISYTLAAPLYFDDTLNYDPSLSVVETSIVNELTGQIVFLDLYSWSHLGTSGSGLVPPLVDDSLLVDLGTGIDTMVVESVGSYTHYYGQNSTTLEIYDMEIDSVIYNLAWNTVTVQDPYQSWYFAYAFVNGGELWGTRNALRLSAPDQQWGVVARNVGNVFTSSNQHQVLDVEFSEDLNNIYISRGGSSIIRLDGLGNQYTSDPNFTENAYYHTDALGTPNVMPLSTSVLTFNVGGSTEGIGLNPSDPNDLVIFTGFGNNNIKRSLNAAGPAPTVSNVGTISGPNSPASYDGIIDRENDQIIVVGTSSGVFVTEDGGTTWEDGSIGFCGTPVFEVRQSWRSWNQGNFRPGEIYVGTYGRGIWSTSSYLSTNENYDGENNGSSIEEFDSNLFSYPNPTSASTSLSFELANASDVTILVYNLSGRLVKSINKKSLSQGSQVIDIEGADLTTGTYIVKMFAGKQQATTKFVKM